MPSLLARSFRSSRRAPLVVTIATVVLLATACGDAPPPPAKATPIRNVRVHVANGSRFDICRVEACGQPGRAVDSQGPTPNDPPLKPRSAGLYEIRECKTGPLVAIACPDAQSPQPPCLKAEGGAVQDGTMFRIAPCAL